MMSVADQLRELGLDGFAWSSVLAERAELQGDRFDPAKTLVRLRNELDFYERQLGEMRAFAEQWGAPMSEVTDNYDDYSVMALRLRQAIERLEMIPSAPPA